MSVTYTHSWTGADHAAWDSAKWATTFGGTGTEEILANAGRQYTSGVGYGQSVRAKYLEPGQIDDLDITVDMNHVQRTGVQSVDQQFPKIHFRSDANFSAVPSNDEANGYQVGFGPWEGILVLAKRVAGVSTTLVSVSQSFASTGAWRVRLRVVGTSIKVKIWAQSTTEPGGAGSDASWAINTTDSTFTNGWVCLSVNNGLTTGDTSWDNLSLNALNAVVAPTTTAVRIVLGLWFRSTVTLGPLTTPVTPPIIPPTTDPIPGGVTPPTRPPVGDPGTTLELYMRLPAYMPAQDATQSDGAGMTRPLLAFLGVLTQQLTEIDQFLDRAMPGEWPSDLINPFTADVAWLPWLAQLVGVDISTVSDIPTQRSMIANAVNGPKAGTLSSVQAAVIPLLTGGKRISITAHTGGDPWHVTITVYGPEVTDQTAIEGALAAVKPAGVEFTLNIVAGITIGQLAGMIGDLPTTYPSAPTIGDLAKIPPP